MKNGIKEKLLLCIQFEILQTDNSKHLTLYFFLYTKNIVPVYFSCSSEHSALSHIRHHDVRQGNKELPGNHMQSLPGVQGVLEQWDGVQGSV